MKYLISIFILLGCISQTTLGQEAFEELKFPDAGDTYRVSFFTELDDRYILVLLDKNSSVGPTHYVYDVQENSVLNLVEMIDGVDFYFPYNASGLQPSYSGFAYENGIFYHTLPSVEHDEYYLVEFDLDQRKSKSYQMEDGISHLFETAEVDNRRYFIFGGSGVYLYELSEGELNLIENVPLEINISFLRVHPKEMPLQKIYKDKWFIMIDDFLRCYDFKSGKMEVLAHVNSNTGEDSATVLTQIVENDDKLYFVFKDAIYKGQSWPPFHYFEYYTGHASVWETDGTQAGTKELFQYDMGNTDYHIHTNNCGLLDFEGKLYWSGVGVDDDSIPIYKVEGSQLRPIDMLSMKFPSEFNIYYNPDKTWLNDFLESKKREVRGKEYISATYAAFSDSYGVSYFFDLWTIEDDKISYLLNKRFLESSRKYDGIPIVETLGSKLVSVSDESALFHSYFATKLASSHSYDHKGVFSVIDLSTRVLTHLDSLSVNGEPYFSDEKEHLPILLDDQVYFIFGQKEGKGLALWKYDMTRLVSVENHLSNKKLDWLIYPNPSSQSFTIESLEYLSGSLMITAADGRVHQTHKIDGHQKQIDVSQLPNGMYIAVYQYESKIETKTFIIQR